jgi:site-specific DNA-adenine methylase
MGTGASIRSQLALPKSTFNDNYKQTLKMLSNCFIHNKDYIKFLDSIYWRDNKIREKSKAFVYADPPYHNTGDNYSNSFTEKNTTELFDYLMKLGVRFAISEFDSPLITELTHKYNLVLVNIITRNTLKNTNNEVLIMNYDYKTENNTKKLF